MSALNSVLQEFMGSAVQRGSFNNFLFYRGILLLTLNL